MAYAVIEATLPAQSAGGATSVTILGEVPSQETTGAFRVNKLSLTSPSLVTGAATNYATANFRQMRAGSAVATIGTLALLASSVTLPAEVETDVPVSGSPSLLPGDIIDVQLVQTGTGLAIPAGVHAKAEIS